MSRLSPAAALNGVQCGNVCSGCNRRIRTGDLVRAYATHYETDGWLIRRLMCNCGSRTIGLPTDGADEVIVEAVWWAGRLVGVKTVDRSRP
jgi:hypothetical protein